MNDLRLLCIGAHPDDCEFQASGLAALVAAHGGTVRFLSMTDGASGHHEQSSGALVARRAAEAIAGAAAVGAHADNAGFEDGWLSASRAVREAVITAVRRFSPHVIVCPRPFDYHPDHRYTGVAVQDASYLMMVPNIVPNVPIPEQRPILLHMSDPFTVPVPFRPDIVIDIASVVDQKVNAIMAHESQVYEWLPVINGFADEVPNNEPERTAFLQERELDKCRRAARTFRAELLATYGSEIDYAEAYEISEYGAPATVEQVRALLSL